MAYRAVGRRAWTSRDAEIGSTADGGGGRDGGAGDGHGGKSLTGTWTYFTGSGWSSTPSAAERLPDSDGTQFNVASDEFSVVQTSGGYRLVESQDSIFQIAIYSLGAPQGPIPAGTVLPTSAEPEGGQPAPPRQQGCSPCGTGTLLVYNAPRSTRNWRPAARSSRPTT